MTFVCLNGQTATRKVLQHAAGLSSSVANARNATYWSLVL
jgi:hypothetical protein